MKGVLDKSPRIQEFGDHIYITSPVQLYAPEASDIEQFAFAQDVKGSAPNPKLLWLRGQYVEADEANRNGDQWTAGELAIKALTPVLMPITVMHDLRTAVGTIADARLRTPDADGVPRSRIDTVLALWAHRFPEIAEEAQINAAQGTLMQSMECISPAYDCSECGATFHRLPKGAERRDWCPHLLGDTIASEGRAVARILRSVTFTGVGLIFGTRGARGAYPDAYLEVEELAAFHRDAHTGTAGTSKRTRRKNIMEIEDSKYEALVADKTAAEAKVTELTAAVAERDTKLEAAEAAKVAAEEAKATAVAEAEQAKEATRVASMREERLAALGAGFKAKLDKLETTKARVAAQAGEMSDEEWKARLDELGETIGVKADAEASTENEETASAGTLFTREQVAGSVAGGAAAAVEEVTAAAGSAPSAAMRSSVIGGLVQRPARTKAKA